MIDCDADPHVTVTRFSSMSSSQVSECDQCGGTGQQSTPCGTCGGDGRVRKSKKINLRIPAGVDDGSRLRVRGEGNAGRRGGENGDLYVFLSVKPDKGESLNEEPLNHPMLFELWRARPIRTSDELDHRFSLPDTH